MAVTQRERTEVPLSHRSILPSVPGVPAGAAVLIAVTCTFVGFLIDARGGDELTGTFASLYVAGCVLAVLSVRYRGLFTTLVLPPLLMFVAVPLSYQLLLGSAGSLKLKDILLNLAIPLVNRFPTMALATVIVLIVGAVRIALHRRESKADESGEPRKTRARATRPGARAQRTRSTDAKDPARRRLRPGAEAAADSGSPETETARSSRRGTGRVAAGPPRVGANRQPGEGRRRRAQDADQATAERNPAAEGRRRAARPDHSGATTTEGRRRAQYAEQSPRTGDRRAATGDQPRTGERRTAPADRTRNGERPAGQPTPEAAAGEGRRRRAQSPEQAATRGAERHAAPERNPAPTEGGRRRRGQPSELPPHPRPNVRYRERDSGRIER
ncbi:DUF6542 domain-containing protein [Nocardia aurantiaca]|uniref:DUF6542 domain-containing protein n=1 Tax=Nocardia aurantiaca TaxID=2675850 RepID=A0A6I3L0B1_9NOCA|nr:DUF6542 domain-containing protein [Nocardia aurantiaca]MTE15307.1 hypothetical protein [Nocardia aurantiaca]